MKSGINSEQYYKTYVSPHRNYFGAEVVIISLGSNDSGNVKTYAELQKLRDHVKAERVYWILPNPEKFPNQSQDVTKIANQFGDTIIQPKHYSSDRIHPTSGSYKEIAAQVE